MIRYERLRHIMCADNHISPIWPHGTSIRIPRQGFAHIYKWYQAHGISRLDQERKRKGENGPKASSSSLPPGPRPKLP
jgi:hypothetical protein